MARMVRTSLVALALAQLVACTSDEIQLVFEGESLVYNLDVEAQPVGIGLMVHVDVIHLHSEAGDEEPSEEAFATDALTVELTGATQVPCDKNATGFCLIADDAATLQVELETPAGHAEASRVVTRALQLSANTPRWGRAPVSKIQVRPASVSPLWLVFTDPADQPVAGHTSTYETSATISFDGKDVTTTAPGDATLTATETGAPPLQIRVIDAAASLASIKDFAVDRVWGRAPGHTLTAYTKGPVGAVIFDGFDADGFLALQNLPLEVTAGPGLKATSYPVPGYPCATNDYCFLRGVLPDGTNEMMSYVDVTAGTSTKRFTVRVVRGEY
jgi:hypothetical protein